MPSSMSPTVRPFRSRGVHVQEVEFDIGIVRAEAGEQAWQEVPKHGVRRRQPHAALEAMDLEPRLAQGVLDRVKDLPRVLMEQVAFGRQRNPMGQAVEQAHRKPLLERQHRIRDGRLRNMFGGRCHRELACFRRRDKVAELPQCDFLGQPFRRLASLCHGCCLRYSFVGYQLSDFMILR